MLNLNMMMMMMMMLQGKNTGEIIVEEQDIDVCE